MCIKSTQPLSGDHLKPRYAQKCVFGRKCPNLVIWLYLDSGPPKIEIFALFNPSSSISGDHFSPRYVKKCVFGPKCPNMVIWLYLAPDPPTNHKFQFFDPTSSTDYLNYRTGQVKSWGKII